MINEKGMKWSMRGITLAAIVALLGNALPFVITEYSQALVYFFGYMAAVVIGIIFIIWIEGVGNEK